MKSKKLKYNCLKCPGYCCSYDRIEVTKKDIGRLANHFGQTEAEVKKKHLKKYKHDDNGVLVKEIILKHKKDHIYTSVCKFLNRKSRSCTIYNARPSVCREYPDSSKCGYYEFLKFERKQQEDKEFVPTL